MPCPRRGQPPEVAVEIRDLLELHPFVADLRYTPRTKSELVDAVRDATAAGKPIRALGSAWSPSDAFTTGGAVIDTSELRKHVSSPYPASFAELDADRLRHGDTGSALLASLAAALPPLPFGERPLIHVEAGIKLGRMDDRRSDVTKPVVPGLLDDLEATGLALPTMGGGGGQSLAGVLGTATHGGDFDTPPLPDWVRAVHLVAPNGQEWWVTGSGVTLDTTVLASLPDWCPDCRVVADDDVLNAVRVGVGRLGVVYAVVLEVVPMYGLLEVNTRGGAWSTAGGLREQLAASATRGTGLFDTDVTRVGDADGWLHETLVAPLDIDLQRLDELLAGERERGLLGGAGDAWWLRPATADRRAGFLAADEVTSADGGSVLSSRPRPLRHLNIVILLGSRGADTWIERRWQVPTPLPDARFLRQHDRDELTTALLEQRTGPAAEQTLRDLFDPTKDKKFRLTAELSSEWVGWAALKEFRNNVIPPICAMSPTSTDALMAVLVAALRSVFALGDDAVKGTMRSKVAAAIGGGVGVDQDIRFRSQPWRPRVLLAPATRTFDTHDYALDGLQHGHSCEFHFDAGTSVYLDFIDAVLAAAQRHDPVLGLIGVRFTPSEALVAMQQAELNASVEVQVGRGRDAAQDHHAAFFDEVMGLGHDMGGVAHWGQEFVPSVDRTCTAFGESLQRWRQVLTSLAGGNTQAFRTDFSVACGLEPAPDGWLTGAAASDTEVASTVAVLVAP